MKQLNNETTLTLAELRKMGLQGEVRGDEFVCLCAFHREKTPSMFVNLTTGKWCCFGCGDGGSLQELRQRLGGEESTKGSERVVPADAVESVSSGRILSRLKEHYTTRRVVMREGALDCITEASIEQSYAYLRRRGLTKETLMQFGVRDGRGAFAHRAVIPIIGVDGMLLSATGRSVITDEQSLKVRKVANSKAKDTLFGLYQLRQSGYIGTYLILVEGEIDAMSGQQCGYPTVGIMSLSITDKQLALVAEYHRAVLLLDRGVSVEVSNKLLRRISSVTGVQRLYMKQYKDINEALQMGGAKAVHAELRDCIEVRRQT